MSTVIKRGQQGKPLQRLSTFDLADHMSEARAIVASARVEARRILVEARGHSRTLKEEAQRAGHQQGYEKGLPEGRSDGRGQALSDATERFDTQRANLAAAMQAAVDSIEGQKRDLMIAAQRDLLSFAVALARKVTGRIGELDRQAVVSNVERALRLVGTKTDLRIRVHPIDAETMRQFAAGLSERLDRTGHVELTEDDAMAPGGAVVEAGGTQVDARIETQIEQIAALLLGDEEAKSEK
ncbi:MAG: hypothetical protein IID40_05995 [Planctomycetes bacterium]|nr:hypothetical protein [Planctomycetota bacterium]